MLRNKLGQMSMMFIVVIAIALVCLAMTMNWNRMAQVKTQCQISATSAAAVLASRMASYGHNLIKTQLKGEREQCNWTGVFAALLTIILLIIIIFIAIMTGPAAPFTASGGLSFVGALYVSLAFAVATLVIQVAVIQPGITKMWNKLQQNIKTVEDQFLESGLQTALMTVATDSEEIPDVMDYNMNGRWNIPGNSKSSNDTIARLTYHYTARLADMKSPDDSEYKKFKDVLALLMTSLGMDISTVCCGGSGINANFCNAACSYVEPTEPADNGDDLAIKEGCNLTPFKGYPFSFDPLFCSRVNKPNTLVGLLGRDDSNSSYKKDTAFNVGSSETTLEEGSKFRAQDSDGSLFPLLWQLKELGDSKIDVGGGGRHVLPDVVTSDDLVKQGSSDSCPGDPNGIWRPGNDLFCSQNWNGSHYTAPHYAQCQKFDLACLDNNDAAADCSCSVSPRKDLWFDDKIDEDWVGLREVAIKAALITNDSRNILAYKLDEIDSDLKQWIDFLEQVKKDFIEWNIMLKTWRDGEYKRTSVDSNEVFCEGSARPAEAAGTTSVAIGSLQGVINCEKYYATDAPALFEKCQDECTVASAVPDSCTNRPRSLAADGLAFDVMDVDCSAGSDFRKALPAHVQQAKDSAELFADRVALLEGAQKKADILMPALDMVINNDFTLLDEIMSLYDKAKKKVDENAIAPSIIYGWEGAPPKGAVKDAEGKWSPPGRLHIVKVEAYTPKRCARWSDDRGGIGNACGTDTFPWIKTEKKGSFKRCYRITDTDGCVKVRVSRFDEDSGGNVLGFGGGTTKLWQFTGQHPKSMGIPQSESIKNIRDFCFAHEEDNIIKKYQVQGSFMINRMTDSSEDPPGYKADYSLECRNAAVDLISRGFVTEVCAKYYLDGNDYKMKFVPCGGGACASK